MLLLRANTRHANTNSNHLPLTAAFAVFVVLILRSVVAILFVIRGPGTTLACYKKHLPNTIPHADICLRKISCHKPLPVLVLVLGSLGFLIFLLLIIVTSTRPSPHSALPSVHQQVSFRQAIEDRIQVKNQRTLS